MYIRAPSQRTRTIARAHPTANRTHDPPFRARTHVLIMLFGCLVLFDVWFLLLGSLYILVSCFFCVCGFVVLFVLIYLYPGWVVFYYICEGGGVVMAYVAPSLVNTGDSVTSAGQNVIVNDIIDHESRITTNASNITTNTSNITTNASNILKGVQSYTTVQKTALTGVTTGTMVYDSTLGYFQVYNGSAWINLSNSLAPSAGGSISGGGFLTGAASFSTATFTLFGRAELRATFVKRNTASKVLATMGVSGAHFNSGIGNQSFNAGMYNPTSGSALVAVLCAPSTGTYSFGGSAVIWSGLAAGSYTVEPVYSDNASSSVTTFYGGGGAYGVASSSVVYSLLEIN